MMLVQAMLATVCKTAEKFRFPADELLQGGKLELEMRPKPNKNWGI